MITIVSGTNRRDSNTAKVAKLYYDYLQSKGVESTLLDLVDFPTDFISPDMYEPAKSDSIKKLQDDILFPTTKYIMVVPEYNGSIPGIFKLMIDAVDIKNAFYHKKACLTGVSTGRAGNLRGLDTLTNMLHYIKMDVFQLKIPISGFGKLMDEKGNFTDQATIDLLKQQTDQFIDF